MNGHDAWVVRVIQTFEGHLCNYEIARIRRREIGQRVAAIFEVNKDVVEVRISKAAKELK